MTDEEHDWNADDPTYLDCAIAVVLVMALCVGMWRIVRWTCS